jgi:hypothetical protein
VIFRGAAKAAQARGASNDHAVAIVGRSARESRERLNAQLRIGLEK